MGNKILLEAPWLSLAHSYNLSEYPPDGYEFIQAGNVHISEQRLFKAAGSSRVVRGLFGAADWFIPLTLARSWFLQRWSKPPIDTVLTYSIQHLVFRPEPWVVEVETPTFLIGDNVQHLKTYKGFIERSLASVHCKKIIYWSEAVRNSFLSALNCENFTHKMEKVYLAVPSKHFVRNFDSDSSRPLKLLFVGSMRTPQQFAIKGGREAVEAFIQLQKQYANIKMVVKSEVPKNLKALYEGIHNLKIIDRYLPREELEKEYITSDIFITPSHNTTPQTILEAMNYELAVISLRSWANAEYIEDGKTGLLVEPSWRVPWENYGSREFKKAIRDTQAATVEQLVKKISLLIENADLRKRLALAGRYETETGRFSISARNAKLKLVFDEAIGIK